MYGEPQLAFSFDRRLGNEDDECRLLMYQWQLRRRKSCLTQEELVKAYQGPDFDLADRYGEVNLCMQTCSTPDKQPVDMADRY